MEVSTREARQSRPGPPLRLSVALLSALLGALASTGTHAAAAAATSTSARKVTYKLQHAFGLSQPFTDRGHVEVLVDNGALRALQPSSSSSTAGEGEDEGKGGGLAISPQELAAASVGMRDAAGGWYRIRALAEGQGAAAAVVAVMTSVPVCDVVRAGFKENITLTLDGQTGHLISLEYTPWMSRLSPKSCQGLKPLEAGAHFTTAVNVAVDQPAQSIPLIAPAMARPPGVAIRFDEAGGDRQPPQEKSFLQKYWIFIVLAWLLLNTGGTMPEEEEGQRAAARAGGQQQGGGAGAGAGAVGGGARQRRTG